MGIGFAPLLFIYLFCVVPIDLAAPCKRGFEYEIIVDRVKGLT